MSKKFNVSKAEVEVLKVLEQARPPSLRQYDQIPMHGEDLLQQVKRMAPLLANKTVAFVGDHDGTSLLLGLLYSKGLGQAPSRMVLLDFDERLLVVAQELAIEYGFDSKIETGLYNVFNAVPPDLTNQFDVFYTNPPYGAYNFGASARL